MSINNDECTDLKTAKIISIIACVCFVVSIVLEIVFILDFINSKNYTKLIYFSIVFVCAIPGSIYYMFYYTRAKKCTKLSNDDNKKESK